MDFKAMISDTISAAVSAAFGVEFPAADALPALELPPTADMGDFAFPCFKLAKLLRKAPPAIAETLCAAVTGFAGEVKAASGYLNFYIDREMFARETLAGVVAAGADYGAEDIGNGRVVCLDYSSVNIAKSFHIGHLSTTAIGNALNRMYKFVGYKTISINHLGDWGTQFGKTIAAYKLWGDDDKIKANPVNELMALYVKFHDEAEKDPSLDDLARAWFKRIESGDEEALRIYHWFKDVTLGDVRRVYDTLGIHFDSWNGEAFFADKWGRVVDELREKGLLQVDQGASLVDLSDYKMPPCLILKTDGASLYATRDIATALWRKDEYNFDQTLYVVAYEQDLYFKQFFKVIELMGYEWAKNLHHVSFGMVSLEEGALSTRGGRMVYLEDLLNRSIEKVRAIIEEKSPNLADKDAVAQKIGVAAVLWIPLYNNRIKDIVFSFDRALNFDGETAPYVMYTHARCCSVLAKIASWSGEDYAALSDPQAQDVIRLLYAFPSIVKDAVEKLEPSMITRFTVDLAQAYNRFYFENRILGEAKPVEAARLTLTRATRDVLKTALGLLGMDAPEKM